MAQALDLVVDGRVLLDIGVRVGNIRLGLVVVVVTDEVFDRVFREKFAEFRAELGREGLVMRQNEGRAVDFFDDGRHREGLAGAGDAEQDLLAQAVSDALGQRLDRLGLVARGAVWCVKFEIHNVLRKKKGNVVLAGMGHAPALQGRYDRHL